MKEEPIKIEALTKFNDGVAFVLNRKPNLIWRSLNNKKILYGTDGVFYNVLGYGACSGSSKAFGGSKFTVTLEDGEQIECYGQYWSGGHGVVEKELGIKLCSTPIGTIEGLKSCYVFSGMNADIEKINELREVYKSNGGVVYPYYDYEKIIKYDDLQKRCFSYSSQLDEIFGKRKTKDATLTLLKNYQDHKEEQRRAYEKRMEEELTEEDIEYNNDYRNFI